MYICILMYLHIYDYVMVSVLVILRSTTGLYGRPIAEVAYGEILFSLHRGCMGVDSSGRVVGMSTLCHPCWDISGSIPVWAQCIIFFLSFYNIKTYNYVLKSICSIKKHWWSLTLSWPDEVQRMFLTAHRLFMINVSQPRHFSLWVLKDWYSVLLLYLYSFTNENSS